MSVQMQIQYEGDKHCVLTHGPSGAKIQTDAPKDNFGKGEAFSPTDLVGAAIGSCILTTIAILAEKKGWSLGPCQADVEKTMTPAPRRIESLKVRMRFEQKLSNEQLQQVHEWTESCPVHRSLHPDVKIEVEVSSS